jgi:hypothetical protein
MWKNNLNNMPSIKVGIDKFISDDQPGFVECSFIDAWGKQHTVQEKIPVVTDKYLDTNSNYPQEGVITCIVIKEWQDKEGRLIITVDTERPWDVDTIEGLTQFDLLYLQVEGY